MSPKPPRYGAPEADSDARRRGDCQARQSNRRDGTRGGVVCHRQSAGGHQQQDNPDLNPAEIPMPFRKTRPKAFADQDQPQHERDGPRDDVGVKRPLIGAEEVAISTAEEVRSEIGREVVQNSLIRRSRSL